MRQVRFDDWEIAALENIGAAPGEQLSQRDRHFASGVNHAGEVVGLARAGNWVGITATEVAPKLLEELAVHYGGTLRVFVDSGAFSEVKFGPAGREVVKPITDADWVERLELYRRMAGEILRPRQCYLVAPDCVGDQVETLRRLERYAGAVRELVELGANVIVPVQKGELPMSAMFARACDILGVDPSQVIAGVPSKKDATSAEDLAELCRSFQLPRRARVHLLGLGPDSKRFASILAAALEAAPHVEITSDSVTIRRMVGRTNGRGGGPRRLTAAQDAARAAGCSAAYDVKAYALAKVGHEDNATILERRRQMGWFDPELQTAPGVDLVDEAELPAPDTSAKERPVAKSVASLLLGLGLVACGPAPAVHSWEVDGLLFDSDHVLEVEDLAFNVALVRDVMGRQGPKLSRADFDRILGGVSIYVHDATSWEGCGGRDVVGCTWDLSGRIELDRTTGSLSHELLHVYEDRTGRPFNGHADWNERGYLLVQFLYRTGRLNPSGEDDIDR